MFGDVMVRNIEQDGEVVSERIRKRQVADAILLEMFSLDELPKQSMTAEEQYEIGKRIARGEQSAKQEYILRRLRYAMMIAFNLERNQPETSTLTLEDHFQNVIEAMQNKLDEYPMLSEEDFIVYMGWVFTPAEKEGNYTSTTVRIPQHIYEKWSKIERFVDSYKRKNNKEPSDEEIAFAVGLRQGQDVELREYEWRRDLSNLPLELAEEIEDGDVEVFRQVYLGIKEEKILAEIQKLPDREKKVLELRFGLKDNTPRTQEEVGQLLNRSHGIISRVEIRALDRLRALLEAKDLRRNWVD